jgi:hypothetical protein
MPNTETIESLNQLLQGEYVFCKNNFPVFAKWFLQRSRQGVLRVVTPHQ